jgi:Kef-type K+ transport system membrane component KefB
VTIAPPPPRLDIDLASPYADIMRKVLLYSMLLVFGLIGSQFIDRSDTASDTIKAFDTVIKLATMIALSFIMIHVGYEFEIDKSRPKQYVWDYVVAGTAAAFPWIFCALYFIYVMAPSELWGHFDLWKESLLESRFASPTSAGVLFSMLAAAGLAATWVFKKARVLAIFDDLDTILLMIPLKIMMVGFKWQLAVIVLLIMILLWMAWKYLHVIRAPITWPWVIVYSAGITAISEAIYAASKVVDIHVPIHLEVLLPAFVVGCMLARPAGADPHGNDATEGAEEGPETPGEQRVSTIVSACFMVLVGLSMPAIQAKPDAARAETSHSVLKYEGASAATLAEKKNYPGWGTMAMHVLAITALSNLGKMFPSFCYRKEATFRERLALSIGMFPRGEVGAGVLVISLSYGLGGPSLTVAVLSLALNLLLTGVFILIVKKLLAGTGEDSEVRIQSSGLAR